MESEILKILQLGKKGKTQISAGICLLIFLGLVVVGGITGGLVWYFTKPTIPPPVPPLPVPLADSLTTVHNGQENRNVPIDIHCRNIYDPNLAIISGLTITIYTFGSSPAQLAAQGIDPNEAEYLDSFATDANGKGTSNRNFQGGTKLTAVAGSDTTTNKSQLINFVVQGLDSMTLPTSVDCGVFFYAVMTEENEAVWTWCDKQGTTISDWNYTADTDGLLEAKIKLVVSTSGESLRNIWSRKYGDLQLMLVIKVTHYNSTSSAAIDVESEYDDKGTPSNQLVFAIELDEIIYEIDSTGAIEEDHESYRYFTITLDFSGCGFPAYASATCTRFTIGGWALIEQNVGAPCSAGLPSGDSLSWFQDAISALNVTT